MSPEERFGVGFRGVVGRQFFLAKIKEKGEGGGEGWGWGQAKEPASESASFVQDYPLANYPLVSPPTFATLPSSQRSSWALQAQSLETELKMSSWGLPASGSKKLKSESKKCHKQT